MGDFSFPLSGFKTIFPNWKTSPAPLLLPPFTPSSSPLSWRAFAKPCVGEPLGEVAAGSRPTCVLSKEGWAEGGETRFCTFPPQSNLRASAQPPLQTLENPHGMRSPGVTGLNTFCCYRNCWVYQCFPIGISLLTLL